MQEIKAVNKGTQIYHTKLSNSKYLHVIKRFARIVYAVFIQ